MDKTTSTITSTLFNYFRIKTIKSFPTDQVKRRFRECGNLVKLIQIEEDVIQRCILGKNGTSFKCTLIKSFHGIEPAGCTHHGHLMFVGVSIAA